MTHITQAEPRTVLQLALKGEYFDQIKAGTKPKEYRLCTKYWAKRLVGRSYTRIVLTLGYPPRSDLSRRMEMPWNGYTIETIQHPHFGADPVTVFAINVEAPAP